MRNLRDADFSSLVVILPVKSAGARARWTCWWSPATSGACASTPTSSTSERHAASTLTTSLSENNLFGWRKKAAVVFELTQGNWTLGPTYRDPNVAGTRLTSRPPATGLLRPGDRRAGGRAPSALSARLPAVLAGQPLGRRDVGLVHRSDAPLLRSQRAEPGVPDATGDGAVPGPDGQPITVVGENFTALPYIYRDRRKGFEPSVVRSFGKKVIQRVYAGYSLSSPAPTSPRVSRGRAAGRPAVRPGGVPAQRKDLRGVRQLEPVHPALPGVSRLRDLRPARGLSAGPQRLRHRGPVGDRAGFGLQLHPGGRQLRLELRSRRRLSAVQHGLVRPVAPGRFRRRDALGRRAPGDADDPQGGAPAGRGRRVGAVQQHPPERVLHRRAASPGCAATA